MAAEKNMNEIYFEWWCQELQSIGLVLEFEAQPQRFILANPFPIFYEHKYSRKEPIYKDFNLFQPITYTCDYRVRFSVKLFNKLFGIFFTEDKKLISDFSLKTGNVYQNTLFYVSEKGITFEKDSNNILYIDIYFDVKPPSKALKFSGKLGSSRDFKFNQRMTFDKHNIYVNKVVPDGTSTCLYNKTFVPKRFLYTDGGNQLRKKKSYLNYRTMEQYLTLKEIL